MSRYWRFNLLLIAALLLFWVGVTFGVPFFAANLRYKIFGGPFSFWMAAQGALLAYLAIVAFYGWIMNRLDAQHQRNSTHPNDPKALNG